jgi:bifunctional polynucleotide phosphatase/kinase
MEGTIIYQHKNPSQYHSPKLALFDVDWTLIKPKDGRTFPKHIDDWMWLRKSVPTVLQSFHKKNFEIVFITDQSKKWKVDMIHNVCSQLDLPITVLIAMKKELHKPNPTLFSHTYANRTIDLNQSFMVGDAGGRKGDWSSVDKDLANAIHVQYITPESIFPLDQIQKVKHNLSDPTKDDTKEIIIMVGYPGSGKTHIATHHFPNYSIISGDTLKTPAKMIKYARSLIEQSSIVFDATNGTKDKRALYISFAKEHNIPVRCIWVHRDINVAMEQCKEREMKGGKHIPKIAFYAYRKRFQPPTNEEGCTVIKI